MRYNDNINKNKNNIKNNKRVNSSPVKVPDGYFLLSEAADKCSYSQEYLSLLARRGELKADKIGRRWYTTIEWLRNYIELHPAEKKGNIKGEFFDDSKYKKVIQCSDLNQPVKFCWKKVASVYVNAIIGFFNGFRLFLRKLLSVLDNNFILIKIFSLVKTKIAEVVLDKNNSARKQSVIEDICVEIEIKLRTSNLCDLAILFLPKFRNSNTARVHYPFARGSNKYILESVFNILESAIETATVNPIRFLFRLVADKFNLVVLNFRIAVISLAQRPVFVARHSKVLPWWYKLETVACLFLILFFVGVSVFSFTDYKTADKHYMELAGLYNSLLVEFDNSRDSFDYIVSDIYTGTRKLAFKTINDFSSSYSFIFDYTRDYIYFENKQNKSSAGVVAGVSTYNLPKYVVSKAFIGLDNVNKASSDISRYASNNGRGSNFLVRDYGEKLGLKLFMYLDDFNLLPSYLAKSSVYYENRIIHSRTEFVFKHQADLPERFFEDGNKSEVNKELAMLSDIYKSFLRLKNEMNRKLLENDTFFSRSSQFLSANAVKLVISNYIGWPVGELDDKKMESGLVRLNSDTNTASIALNKNLSSLVNPTSRIIEDKSNEYSRLERLAQLVLDGLSDSLGDFELWSDKLFGTTGDSLGDAYLALLNVLNLQPAYNNYSSPKTLVGVGDQPLEIERGPVGLRDQGLAIVPLEDKVSDAGKEELANKIKNVFSDEVEVTPDKDSASGMIKPAGTEVSFEDYMYVVVPLKGE